MLPSKRALMFTRLREKTPEPCTELEYENNYQLLVSVVLSAQATDKSVNMATKSLFKSLKTPHNIIQLGEEKLMESIKTIGLFRTKAKNLMALSKILIDQYDGEIPNTRKELEQLPGVGRKTANVILNTAFGKPTIAVDTHVFRVANRTGLASESNVLSVEKKLLKVVPKEFKHHAHHWLILHGRYTCLSRKPKCPTCLISDICSYQKKIT